MSIVAQKVWIVFVIMGVILVLFGVTDYLAGGSTYGQGEQAAMRAVSGMTWNELRATSPGGAAMLDFDTREGAVNEVLIGLFGIALAWSGFRRGERWAWFLMWLWPIWIVSHIAILYVAATHPAPSTPVPFVSGSIFLVVSVVALAISYRRSGPQGSTAT